jgi:hypothetical protein
MYEVITSDLFAALKIDPEADGVDHVDGGLVFNKAFNFYSGKDPHYLSQF